MNTNSDAFTAYQTTYYTEASYLHAAGPRHTLVLGLNANGEQLASYNRSATPLRSPYTYHTLGAFRAGRLAAWLPRLSLQAGLRLDQPQPVRYVSCCPVSRCYSGPARP